MGNLASTLLCEIMDFPVLMFNENHLKRYKERLFRHLNSFLSVFRFINFILIQLNLLIYNLQEHFHLTLFTGGGTGLISLMGRDRLARTSICTS